MKFKPLGDRALVKLVEREETTPSGMVLPDTAKEKPQTAEVVAQSLQASLEVHDLPSPVSPTQRAHVPSPASPGPLR